MRTLKTLLLLICFSTFCHAQKESITIGPGDTLHIKVLEAPELEQVAAVTDAGIFPLIIGGNIRVVGLTPSEAANVVKEALVNGNVVLTPHVSVVIEQAMTLNVTVLGEVSKPGSYPVGTPRSVLEVLSLAGGLTELASRQVTIERHDTKERLRLFVSNDSNLALDTNPLVRPGDTLIIPKAGIIYTLGDVRRPGGVVMNTNDARLSVLQAVSLAGGTATTAVPSKTRLIRKQPDGTFVEIPLQLSQMQKGERPDMPLQADDILYVPFSYLRNAALGISGLVSSTTSAAIYQLR